MTTFKTENLDQPSMKILTRSRIMKWSTFLKDVLDWKGMPRRLGVKLVRKKFLSSMYRKEAGDETSSENELDNISGPSSKVQYIRRGQREVITFVANQITYLSPSPTSSLNINMMIWKLVENARKCWTWAPLSWYFGTWFNLNIANCFDTICNCDGYSRFSKMSNEHGLIVDI